MKNKRTRALLLFVVLAAQLALAAPAAAQNTGEGNRGVGIPDSRCARQCRAAYRRCTRRYSRRYCRRVYNRCLRRCPQ